jgi:hypothetical protein
MAAAAGDTEGATNLGMLHERGHGVPRCVAAPFSEGLSMASQFLHWQGERLGTRLLSNPGGGGQGSGLDSKTAATPGAACVESRHSP